MTTPRNGRCVAARSSRMACAVLSFFAAAALAHAAESTPKPAAPKPAEEVVALTPFEVSAGADNSYGALQSNSLTAFRLDLAKAPATAQVFTKTFIDDVGATTIEQLLINYAGTVTAGSNNANSSIAMPGDRDGGAAAPSIRGAAPEPMKRDGFTGPKPGARTISGSTDIFSIERVEVIEGPQSILYGAVGGGGVINAVSKRAEFGRQKGSFQFSFDQYGGKRASLDGNYGLKNISVRVAATAAENRTVRYNLGSDFTGLYAEIAFRLGQNSVLRLHTQKTDNNAIVANGPNIDNFLPVGDTRRGKNLRYLALTGQLANVATILDGGVSYNNVESIFGWWRSEHIKEQWNGLVFETKLPAGFSAQVQGYYDELVDNRIQDGLSLVPGAGKTGSLANPYPGTAVRLAAPLSDNQQRNRDKGVRVALLHEKDFRVLGVSGHSQTALGASGFHSYPGFGSGGVDYAYFQADANWNPVINPALAAQYGRVPLATEIYIPVQAGIRPKPLFQPTTARITLGGQNYVRLQRIVTNPANETAQNFKGAVPNNGTGGFQGNFNNNAETHSRYYYAANFTDWFDGRLTTLLGYGFTNFESLNFSTVPPNTFAKDKYLAGWGAGVNYRVFSWLRAYALMSKAAQASGSTDDIIGVPLKTPDANSPVPEFGLKLNTTDGRFSAQFNYNPSTLTRYENKNIGDLSFTDIINPDGINRRFGTGSRAQQRVNLDRTLEAMGLVLTANPTPNWRTRFVVSHLDGNIEKTVAYKQLYNDQFYSSGGVVTYKDNTPVLVDPAGGAGAKTAPLTIAMLNNSASPYYANPNPDSGRITNETLRSVLTTVDPVKGTAATGVAGIPISQIQYNFTSPFAGGDVTIYQEGEKNTGFNEYTFNVQNNYSFTTGPLKGLGVFADVQTYAKNRAYYTVFPGAGGSTSAAKQIRQLYRLPTATVFNFNVSYRFRLPWLGEKYTWATQLNVYNAFNHYNVWVLPSPGNGLTLNARLSAQPRQYVWSNTLSF